jgi:DNA-directed RNA polymerase subunit M/transcription elongation factor TFIIS
MKKMKLFLVEKMKSKKEEDLPLENDEESDSEDSDVETESENVSSETEGEEIEEKSEDKDDEKDDETGDEQDDEETGDETEDETEDDLEETESESEVEIEGTETTEIAIAGNEEIEEVDFGEDSTPRVSERIVTIDKLIKKKENKYKFTKKTLANVVKVLENPLVHGIPRRVLKAEKMIEISREIVPEGFFENRKYIESGARLELQKILKHRKVPWGNSKKDIHRLSNTLSEEILGFYETKDLLKMFPSSIEVMDVVFGWFLCEGRMEANFLKEIEEITNTGSEVSEGVHQCHKCKCKRTTSVFIQMRACDEPQTEFIMCANCGNRWRED